MKMMMIAGLAMVAAASAHADGFSCQTANGATNIKVYDHTQASEGTRTAAVMVLSDSGADAGSKTIARFTDVKGTLSSDSSSFLANVDLRFKDQSNKTALVDGKVELQDLDTIQVTIGFAFNEPVKAGDTVQGSLIMTTREGETIKTDLSCERYLKN
jgi:hypothetical protein